VSQMTTPSCETFEQPNTVGAIVRLVDADKVYYKPDGSVLVNALKEINLEILSGEYISIMGASGSGKSTMLNVLGCLDRLTAGQYLLDGQNVEGLDDVPLSRVRGRKIGFVFQSFNLISALTILENTEIPLFYKGVHRTTRRRKAKEKLELVGLGDRLHHRPAELSGGQQQRAAIARSLINDPPIILADEPTGNLDSVTGKSILEIIDTLHQKEGLTVIMVTHDEMIADRCERIVKLKDGRVDSDETYRRTGLLAES